MKMDETAHTLLLASRLMMSLGGQRLKKHHMCNFFFRCHRQATFSSQKENKLWFDFLPFIFFSCVFLFFGQLSPNLFNHSSPDFDWCFSLLQMNDKVLRIELTVIVLKHNPIFYLEACQTIILAFHVSFFIFSVQIFVSSHLVLHSNAHQSRNSTCQNSHQP